MQELHDDDSRCVGKEGVNGETRYMTQNANHHGQPPTESLERRAQYQHGQNFCYLTQAHNRHDPVSFYAHTGGWRGAQKDAGPIEVTVEGKRVDDRDEPKD